MVAIGGLQGVPEEQMHATGHRMQIRTSTSQRRGPERQGDRLLRQY